MLHKGCIALSFTDTSPCHHVVSPALAAMQVMKLLAFEKLLLVAGHKQQVQTG